MTKKNPGYPKHPREHSEAALEGKRNARRFAPWVEPYRVRFGTAALSLGPCTDKEISEVAAFMPADTEYEHFQNLQELFAEKDGRLSGILEVEGVLACYGDLPGAESKPVIDRFKENIYLHLEGEREAVRRFHGLKRDEVKARAQVYEQAYEAASFIHPKE